MKIGNIILILLALHRFQNEFGHHASGETLPTAHSVQKEQTFLWHWKNERRGKTALNVSSKTDTYIFDGYDGHQSGRIVRKLVAANEQKTVIRFILLQKEIPRRERMQYSD